MKAASQLKSPKTGKKKKASFISETDIKKVYHDIRESSKNLNQITVLLSNFEAAVQNIELFEKHPEEARLLIISLFKSFEHLIQLKVFKKSLKKGADEKRVVLNKWLKAKYATFKEGLLSILTKYSKSDDVLIDVVETYLKLMFVETVAWSKDESFFPTEMYQALVSAILYNSANGEILPDGTNDSMVVEFFFNEYLKKYKDLKFYFLSAVLAILDKESPDNYANGYSKWLTIMREDFFHSIVHGAEPSKNDEKQEESDSEDEFGDLDDVSGAEPEEEPEDLTTDTFVPSPPQTVQKYSAFKSLFGKCWIKVLSVPGIAVSLLKSTLLVLHKRILPHINQPEAMLDFLTACYDDHTDLVIQVLAVNGLFILIQKHNLEYPLFYKKLYALFSQPEILSNRYRSRFFRMADLFLSSTHLSAALVASFIKKMARAALVSNPGAVVIVLPFTYNLLKRHPSCMVMIHNPFAKDNYLDSFDSLETDPLLTNALDSSLWELATLMSHYHPNVATLAKIFQNPFTKASYNIEDFLDWSYVLLLESEASRRGKESMMATEFEEFPKAFGDNGYILWNL